MLSPPSTSSKGGGGGSRRPRYSRSPSGGVPSSKRSKPSSSVDPYDRNHGGGSEQPRLYTSICVKHINPKISDSDIRDLCNKKFSKYGTNSVKIYHKNQDRVAFVNFTNCEDAKKARHAKTGLLWENTQVVLEPVYYRRAVPAEQPLNPGSPRERSPPPPRRHRRPSPPSPPPPPPPPPPPVSSRSHSHRQTSSSRHQRTVSPPHSPPPSRSSRPPRRPYSPYIPLPPDLVDYVGKKSSRHRQQSSPSPVRRPHQKQQQQRSRSPNSHRSTSSSPSHRTNPNGDGRSESNGQHEPTRTLFVENLERDITESKLKEIFGRYGTIEEIDLKKSQSSSKRACAYIQYENMDMAYEARRAMGGQYIGKADCKIGYGKIIPTKYLWVGNIPIDIKRRDLEYAFSRYGQIKTLNYSNGDPTAIVTYSDIEDAIKARTKLTGTIQLNRGQVVRNESNTSPSSRRGFRIDYLDRPTSRRFVIVRPQQTTSNRRESRSSSRSHARDKSATPPPSTKDRARSASNDGESAKQQEDNLIENLKAESHSRTPTPPILNTIKQRRSTDKSETPPIINAAPIAGRTLYSPLGSYLSSKDTEHINNVNELMILCEQLNSSATKSNTALSTVYPVQFILKSHAYDARMHFLAGSPTLASLLLGQPGDLVAAKTELRITQRLRLDQHKLEDLERKLRTSVTNALALTGNNAHTNINGHPLNGSISTGSRKQVTASNQTKFVILIASPKIPTSIEPSESTTKQVSNGKVKNEVASPPPSIGNGDHIELKKEKMDDDDSDEDDELSLSRLISYLTAKEAAGVISIPFHPTYYSDHNHPTHQEIAVLHIFPPCEFSKKLLNLICPTIHFSNGASTLPPPLINDEHLMVVIVHND